MTRTAESEVTAQGALASICSKRVAVTVFPRADKIRWSLDGPEQPAASQIADGVGPPPVLTDSRADLVIWWRWRYAVLKAENARVGNLLVQALGESQGYRVVLQAAFDALHEQARRHDRLREQYRRLRDEYRSHRERTLRNEPRSGRRAVA